MKTEETWQVKEEKKKQQKKREKKAKAKRNEKQEIIEEKGGSITRAKLRERHLRKENNLNYIMNLSKVS